MATIKSGREPLKLAILSVNVARPAVLGMRNGEPVLSGIRKSPTSAAELRLAQCNLEGDGQADLAVHGGVNKAVYAYPVGHWSYWTAEHGLSCQAGTFGENLTLAGAVEDGVRIGDVFVWGEAHLEVSQPRTPCYKLAMHLAREDIAPAMVKTARCGWYMRVLKEARVPCANAALIRQHTDPAAPTVIEVFRAHFSPDISAAELKRLASCSALTESWRARFARRSERSR